MQLIKDPITYPLKLQKDNKNILNGITLIETVDMPILKALSESNLKMFEESLSSIKSYIAEQKYGKLQVTY